MELAIIWLRAMLGTEKAPAADGQGQGSIISAPCVDAEGKMRPCLLCLLHRHLSLPKSSSASRFTAGAAAFFILSQSGERPER
jgi:hypothetical protein